MAPRPDLSMTDEEVWRLLAEPHTGVLSTLDRHGFPHSVGIWYVADRSASEVRMWIYGKSQKARNVERDQRASLLVEHGEPYADLRGALVRGRARIETDPDRILELGLQVYERYFLPRVGIPLDEGPRERIEKQSLKRVVLALSAGSITSWNHGRSPSPTGGP